MLNQLTKVSAGAMILGVLLVAAGANEKKPVGQIVLQMTSTYTGHHATRLVNEEKTETSFSKGKKTEDELDDQVTVTVAGEKRWNIMSFTEGSDGLRDLTETSNSFTRTVTGGGKSAHTQTDIHNCSPPVGFAPNWKTLVSSITSSWTYAGGGPTSGGSARLSLRGGWYSVTADQNLGDITAPGSDEMTFRQQNCGGAETNFTSKTGSSAFAAGIPWKDPMDLDAERKFQDQLSGKFEPNAKRFTRSGHGVSSYTVPGIPGDTRTGSFEVSYTLSLNEEPEQVEAVLIPEEGYEKWVPRAGKDEDTPGNKATFQVVLEKKGQSGQRPNKTAKFKFELSEVSKEPGICLNWPPKDQAKSTLDLKIDANSNPRLHVPDANGQSAESAGHLTQSQVTVTSYDYGAWGKLRVIATLDDDHSPVVAHLEGKPNVQILTIPRDDNGNHVADAWEDYLGMVSDNRSSDADEDSIPDGDRTPGDGLSLYEEYRGFMVSGKHTRTDPDLKDLFIVDYQHLGLGLFAQSQLRTHIVSYKEVDFEPGSDKNPYVINFNHGYANLGTQHALWLKNETMPGLLGIAEGTGPGPPKTAFLVKVDRRACWTTGGRDELNTTIAHELAHASNVWHHGDLDYNGTDVQERQADGTWAPKTKAQLGAGAKDDIRVAAAHGQESGVEECIMRYEAEYFYEAPGGHYRWRKQLVGGQQSAGLIEGEWYLPGELPGASYCTKPDGTGVNDPNGEPFPGNRKRPKAAEADAKRGDCADRFCVNDVKACNYSGH